MAKVCVLYKRRIISTVHRFVYKVNSKFNSKAPDFMLSKVLSSRTLHWVLNNNLEVSTISVSFGFYILVVVPKSKSRIDDTGKINNSSSQKQHIHLLWFIIRWGIYSSQQSSKRWRSLWMDCRPVALVRVLVKRALLFHNIILTKILLLFERLMIEW